MNYSIMVVSPTEQAIVWLLIWLMFRVNRKILNLSFAPKPSQRKQNRTG
jgi:hypothetical protein